MAWIYLLLAGVFEIVWAYSMKLSEGFSKPLEAIITVVFMVLSFVLLSLSMKTLPLSVAYMIWTGIGAIGAFVVGSFVLEEPISLMKVVAAGLILVGLILMKLSTK